MRLGRDSERTSFIFPPTRDSVIGPALVSQVTMSLHSKCMVWAAAANTRNANVIWLNLQVASKKYFYVGPNTSPENSYFQCSTSPRHSSPRGETVAVKPISRPMTGPFPKDLCSLHRRKYYALHRRAGCSEPPDTAVLIYPSSAATILKYPIP